jgi:hypothetical protein
MRSYLVLLICVLACAGCGTKEKTTPELLNDLKGTEDRDRVIAVRTLTNRKGDATQVVPALIEALKDKEPDIRLSAAIGLGAFGEQARDAIPTLQTAQNDHDTRVREAAAKALSRIDPEKFPLQTKPPTIKRK